MWTPSQIHTGSDTDGSALGFGHTDKLKIINNKHIKCIINLFILASI